jgi:hypothetical protein
MYTCTYASHTSRMEFRSTSYTRMHIYTHINTHTCAHVHMPHIPQEWHSGVCSCIQTYKHTHTRKYTSNTSRIAFVSSSCVFIYIYIYMHISCIYIYIYTYIMYTIYIYIYVYTYTIYTIYIRI